MTWLPGGGPGVWDGLPGCRRGMPFGHRAERAPSSPLSALRLPPELSKTGGVRPTSGAAAPAGPRSGRRGGAGTVPAFGFGLPLCLRALSGLGTLVRVIYTFMHPFHFGSVP